MLRTKLVYRGIHALVQGVPFRAAMKPVKPGLPQRPKMYNRPHSRIVCVLFPFCSILQICKYGSFSSITPNFTFERSARSVVFRSKIYTRPLNYTLGYMKNKMSSEDVIASRELEFSGREGHKQHVHVILGKPIQEPNGPWFCIFQIKSESFETQFRVAGEDSMQSILLTVVAIKAELANLSKKHNGSFTWFGENDLGF